MKRKILYSLLIVFFISILSIGSVFAYSILDETAYSEEQDKNYASSLSEENYKNAIIALDGKIYSLKQAKSNREQNGFDTTEVTNLINIYTERRSRYQQVYPEDLKQTEIEKAEQTRQEREQKEEWSQDPTKINPDEWNPNTFSREDNSDITGIVSIVLGLINVIGVITAVATLMLIGVKIMFGSVEQKAQYKEKLVPWVIGAVLVITMTTLPNLVYNLTKDILK